MKITLEKDLPHAYTSFGFGDTFPGRMIERVEYELSDEDILRIGNRYRELLMLKEAKNESRT